MTAKVLMEGSTTMGSGRKRSWRKTADGWEPTDPRLQQIVFQIKAGRPIKEIAGQFGISLPRVSRIARRAGIPPRTRAASA